MSEKKNTATDAVATPEVSAPAQAESEYSVGEFAACAKTVFGVMPECVIAAFAVAGITKATKQEAVSIVKNFMQKEVK